MTLINLYVKFRIIIVSLSKTTYSRFACVIIILCVPGAGLLKNVHVMVCVRQSTCCDAWSVVSGGAALSEIAGPFSASDVGTDCAGRSLNEPLLWVISYAMMALCATILFTLLLLLVMPCRRRHRSGDITDQSSLVRHRIK